MKRIEKIVLIITGGLLLYGIAVAALTAVEGGTEEQITLRQ
jgi:hypothetical protein